MTRYEVFQKLEQLLKLEKTGEFSYNKIVISGELSKSHYDYDSGFYDVSISYLLYQNKHLVRVWFGTIDDGDFGSWNEFTNKDDALSLLEKIVQKFEKITVCPSINDLNKDFLKIGVYFTV